jgi:hypothetical protein
MNTFSATHAAKPGAAECPRPENSGCAILQNNTSALDLKHSAVQVWLDRACMIGGEKPPYRRMDASW